MEELAQCASLRRNTAIPRELSSLRPGYLFQVMLLYPKLKWLKLSLKNTWIGTKGALGAVSSQYGSLYFLAHPFSLPLLSDADSMGHCELRNSHDML